VVFNDVVLAETQRSKQVLETSHPPSYYIPPEDVKFEYLTRTSRRTFCEWKGQASYYTVMVGDKTAENAVWHFSNPTAGFGAIEGYCCFYARCMDACYVDDQLVTPQPGPFYGGWITPDVVGPFKGGPGTMGW
jgi:uncharacterized protein (DUF427 family)